MNLLSRLLRGALSRVTGRGRAAPVQAKYDAASTTDRNRNHWAEADGLSPNAANNPAVRQTLRNRSRYEAQNNGYCKGLLRTRRNDVVGTGPRLQLSVPEKYTDPDFETEMTVPRGTASVIETKWVEWCEAVGLAAKLRVMHETGDRDGECFAVLVNNPALPAVQLDVRLFEADQVTTPDRWWNDPLSVDGIKFDAHGNPVEYHFLRTHPGDLAANRLEYDQVPAAAVIHWFDPDRPNQARGIPATTPGLPLYAQIRRYTGAAVTKAEFGATVSGVMKTRNMPIEYAPAPGPQSAAKPRFDRVELEQGALLTLPDGWEAEGFDNGHPVAGYGEFKREVLTEAGAGLNAPRNLSTKSSSEYNYSSARLDHIPYRADCTIIRDQLRLVVVDRVFRAWAREAVLVPGYLPKGLPPVAAWSMRWQWDGTPSIDPQKDANADDVALKNGSKNLSDVLSERGVDWEEHLRQRAREIKLARELEAEHGLAPGTLYPIEPMSNAPVPQVPEPEWDNAQPSAAAQGRRDRASWSSPGSGRGRNRSPVREAVGAAAD
ncbi:Phage portal protein, lambda family [Gemmata sp. SH-PL17]|uniref:phage portal protein n=1 Tax=Gemmata sp. SH-PL17 TaxID=1630693 RepID=UPI00078D90B6|nr:phage portal protein [Gemmata sp. SH-PL17]AMV29298.1 Phage portal protein, lambda family [Gemmata sp. SH-PL17]